LERCAVGKAAGGAIERLMSNDAGKRHHVRRWRWLLVP
jgi:hypothetical protein